MLYNGQNNGSLYLSVRDAAHRMGLADTNAATRAFDELQALGFIQKTKDAHFSVKASEESRARCWRLNWLTGPGRKIATWDFMDREPDPKTPARKRMERGLRALKSHRRAREGNKLPVLDSNTLGTLPEQIAPGAVLDSDTSQLGSDGFPPKLLVKDSKTHIAITMGDGI